MPAEDYEPRALALPVDSPTDGSRRSLTTSWNQRPAHVRSSSSFGGETPPGNIIQRSLRLSNKVQRRMVQIWRRLTPIQKAAVVVALLVINVLGILFLVYHVQVLGFLSSFAKKWRDITGGWLILWALIFSTSFPPMIGYSTLLTIAGMVYGFPNGWFVAASATVFGSTASFIVCRTLLRSYAERLVANDARFAALALVIKHDGLKLLIMIRLCPLPYSLSNGALATVPTISWPSFMLAGAIASIKLMLHIFVGAKLGEIGENEDMDTKTKLVSYASIAIGVGVGIATGFLMYRKTKQRAAELQEQERVDGQRRSIDGITREYVDDPAALEAATPIREEEDDISLHPAYADYDSDTPAYQDDLVDDGRAPLSPDVFSAGDGDDDEPSSKPTR